MADRLLEIPIASLRSHPANPNAMDEQLLTKLTANINRQDDYPPLIVRPHPSEPEAFQLIDGHMREGALRRLGKTHARCYIWPCSDADALVLIATLNRLHGEDQPAKRAALLQDLSGLFNIEELAGLLPEDESDIHKTLALIDFDLDKLVAAFAGNDTDQESVTSLTFAVTPDEAALVEEAVKLATRDLTGKNRRGRALALIAQCFLEAKA